MRCVFKHLLGFEAQTSHGWIPGSNHERKQGWRSPHWTYKELKPEKKPLSKLKQQTAKTAPRLWSPLLFPLHSSMRTLEVITCKRSTQAWLPEKQLIGLWNREVKTWKASGTAGSRNPRAVRALLLFLLALRWDLSPQRVEIATDIDRSFCARHCYKHFTYMYSYAHSVR